MDTEHTTAAEPDGAYAAADDGSNDSGLPEQCLTYQERYEHAQDVKRYTMIWLPNDCVRGPALRLTMHMPS